MNDRFTAEIAENAEIYYSKEKRKRKKALISLLCRFSFFCVLCDLCGKFLS